MGRRRLSGADFGLPFQPQPPYDFAAGGSPKSTLKSLEAGKDPLYRAKGDYERYYWFEEAGEMMAYHLYALFQWDGRSNCRWFWCFTATLAIRTITSIATTTFSRGRETARLPGSLPHGLPAQRRMGGEFSESPAG